MSLPLSLRRIVLFFLMLVSHFTFSQTIDPSFAPRLATFGVIRTIAEQPDGKVVVAGKFAMAGTTLRRNIARFKADGTVDETFSSGTGTNQEIVAIALQPDNKILIGGLFSTYNGNALPHGLARLLNDGSIDPSFSLSESLPLQGVNGFHVLPDGKILVMGYPTFNGVTKLIRLNDDGSLDNSFTTTLWQENSTSTRFQSNNFALQADGKILVGGNFDDVNGELSGNLVRLNADGTPDFSFAVGVGANNSVTTVVALPDGKVMIGGLFTEYQGNACNKLARLNADGTFDDTFINPLNSFTSNVTRILRQQDGKLIVLGEFAFPKKGMCRLQSDGEYDATFNVEGAFDGGDAYAIEMLNDGTILIGGEFRVYKTSAISGLVNLNATADMVADRDFFVGGVATTYASLTLPDGKILIGGDFDFVNQEPQHYLAKLNTDGTRDVTFDYGTGPNEPVRALAMQGEDKILVGGEFHLYNDESPSRGVARINANGARDATFTGIDQRYGGDGVWVFHIQDDGNIIMAGGIEGKEGTARHNIMRVDADGNLDDTFNSGNHVPLRGDIVAVAPMPDGRIIAGGPVINGVDFYGAFLDGAPDETFYEMPFDGVFSLKTWNDKLALGALNKIWLLNADGTPDAGFTAEENTQTVNAMLVLNGKLLTGGRLDQFDLFSETHLRYYNEDGSLDPALTKPVSGQVKHMYQDPDGNLIVSGSFLEIDGQNAFGVARILIDPLPDAPTALSASTTSPSTVLVEWNDASTTETGFELQRSVNSNENFVTLTILHENSTSFADNDVSQETTYFYRIRATNVRGSSLFSDEISVITGINPLAGISSLTTESVTHTEVKLDWTVEETEDEIDGYEIYRSAFHDHGFELIAAVGADVSTYTDAELQPATEFYYKVRVVYDLAFSDYTAATLATTPENPLQPASDLTAIQYGADQVKLTWTDNSLVETGYDIYRKNGALSLGSSTTIFGSTTFIKTVSTLADVTEFVDNNLVPGVVYSYFVVAVKDGEESSPTSVLSITIDNQQAGAWVQKNNFEGGARNDAVTFVIGEKAYLATGVNGATRYKDLWEYDAETDDWTPKADFPGAARFGAVGFAIHGKGYVGLGNSGGELFDRDLYAYDPSLNEWIKKADFPEDPVGGGGRTSASVFVLDGLAYVVFGNNGTNNPKTVFAYDPVMDEWIPKADFPGDGRLSGFAFATKGRGFAGYGTSLDKYDDLYEYDPEVDTWTARSSFRKPSGRAGATVISPGIVLTGDEGTFFSQNNTKEIHQFLPQLNVWVSWPDFTGAKRGSAAGFRIANRLYFGTGSDGGTSMEDIWEYSLPDALPPAAPADISVAFASLSALDVSWQNVGDTHTSLVVERSQEAETGYTAIATTLPDVTKFTDSGLESHATYYYRVKSVNTDGSSDYVYASGYTAPIPSAPVNFTAEALSPTEIGLTWEEDPQYATSFTIYRDSGEGSFSELFTTVDYQTSFTDTSVEPNRFYIYYVAGANVAGVSPPSELKSLYTLPDAPAISFNAENTSATTASLNVSGADKHNLNKELYQSPDNADFTLLSETVTATVGHFSIFELNPDTKYFFKVRVGNESGYSAFSNTVEVLTRPDIPLNFVLSSVTETEIAVAWTKNANPEMKHRVLIKSDPGASFIDGVTTDPGVSESAIGGLSPDKEYYLALEAVNSTGNSLPSPTIPAITISLPPSNLTVEVDNSGNHLTWEDPSTKESSFVIERSVEAPDNFEVIKVVGPDITGFTDEQRTANADHHYRVLVVNAGGRSAYSNIATASAVDIQVGVEALEIPGLAIYPNPVKDKLLLRFAGKQNLKYEVGLRDLQGKLIYNGQFSPGMQETELSMKALPAGLYVLQISGQGQRTIKLISKE